jgi:hypothetical protein
LKTQAAKQANKANTKNAIRMHIPPQMTPRSQGEAMRKRREELETADHIFLESVRLIDLEEMRLEASMRTADMNRTKGKRIQASSLIIRMEELIRAASLAVILRVPNPMPTPRTVATEDTTPGNNASSRTMS